MRLHFFNSAVIANSKMDDIYIPNGKSLKQNLQVSSTPYYAQHFHVQNSTQSRLVLGSRPKLSPRFFFLN